MGYFKTQIASLSRHGSLELNFYRVHIIYFVLTIILSSIIMYGSGINGNSGDSEATFKLRYIDAIFFCASAMTNTGSQTVNLNDLTGFQQAMLCVLSMMGTLSVTANATIWVRRHFFRKYMKVFLKDSKAAREIVEGIDQERGRLGSLADGPMHSVSSVVPRLPREAVLRKIHSGASRGPKSHHEIGHGGIPYPWEWKIGRNMWSKVTGPSGLIPERLHHYLSFQPSFDQKGRFHSLSEREAEELGGVEYRALGVLMWLLPVYICFWLGLAMVILIPWSYKDSVSDIIRYQQPGNLNPSWWASFLAVAAYSNCGLDLLNQNLIPFEGFYLVLVVVACASLAGNTFFPIFLRCTIWMLAKIIPAHSKLHHSLTFLLHHPRRCFILLFPSISTWYLTVIQFAIYLSLWIFWILLQIGFPTITSIPSGERVSSGFFQSLFMRTTGLYIINMSEIAPALLVLYTAAIYISALPIIISIRSTNVYEERSLGVHKPESSNGENISEHSYIGTHLQRQLTSDAWWVFIGFFLICIVERDALSIPSPGFSLYAIFFEVVSTFGLVGITTGVPYDTYSFCGAWHTLSKLILLVIMLKGRHRWLPMAIDRAVLLPGQELMERMDREYERTGDWKPRAEVEEILREETGKQEEGEKEGQDPTQAQEMREKMQPDSARES